jgi:flagellar hook-associated protein 3 FlgL
MRITNRVVTEKYLRSVNNIAIDLDKYQNQVYTGQKFKKVSEDAPAAVKAFQIRKDLARVEGYKSSIQHAQGMLNNAETSIMKVQELLHDAREKIVQGLNGTQSGEEREIIATHLKNLQHQMLQLLNSNAADVYYFGGNSVREEPFSLSDEGELQFRCKDGDDYKWIKLSEMSSDPADGKAYDLYKELIGGGLFVDIGMGVRSDDIPTSATAPYVDRNSVFTYTLPGISITGVGTVNSEEQTENGVAKKISTNIYDLLGAIADSFASSDYTYEKTDELFGFLYGWEKNELPRNILASSPTLPDGSTNSQYDPTNTTGHYDATLDSSDATNFDQAKYDNLLATYKDLPTVHKAGSAQSVQFAVTNVGTKMQFLSFMASSMDSRELDDLTQQQNTEFVDPAKAIIYYDAQKVAYQAALAMGAQVIPMSIFNYMS